MRRGVIDGEAGMNKSLSWRARAACLDEDPELFFDDAAAGIAEAKAVCRSCPVLAACRAGAQARREEHGVWGGLTAAELSNERARATRARNRAERERAERERAA